MTYSQRLCRRLKIHFNYICRPRPKRYKIFRELETVIKNNSVFTNFCDVPFNFLGYRSIIKKGDIRPLNFFNDSILGDYSFLHLVTFYVEHDCTTDIMYKFVRSGLFATESSTSYGCDRSYRFLKTKKGDITVYFYREIGGLVKIEVDFSNEVHNMKQTNPWALIYYPVNYYEYE